MFEKLTKFFGFNDDGKVYRSFRDLGVIGKKLSLVKLCQHQPSLIVVRVKNTGKDYLTLWRYYPVRNNDGTERYCKGIAGLAGQRINLGLRWEDYGTTWQAFEARVPTYDIDRLAESMDRDDLEDEDE